MKNILVIEDSDEVQKLIGLALDGLNPVPATSLKEAENKLKQNDLRLILLDIDLPDGDGLRFYSMLKSDPTLQNVPTMIVSGHGQVTNLVTAFSLGVEDFVRKPFHPMELRARVLARLKKAEEEKSGQDVLKLDELELHASQQRALIRRDNKQESIDLTAKEFRLLSFLMKRHGQICPREILLNEVWGTDTFVVDRTIDTHISHIRKKIASSNFGIEAVMGQGYRLVRREAAA